MLVCLGLTTALWVAGRLEDLGRDWFWPWRGPSQLVMLWSSTLAMLAILAVVRARALEPVFGGLDEGVRLHRRLGLWALLLLAAHGLLLVLDALAKGTPVEAVLIPFWTGDERGLDILAFYLLLALGALAYNRRLRHERWLALHRLVGLLFVLGTLHAAIEPGTIALYEPLRTWVVILLLVGAAAWLYRVLMFRHFGPRYRYAVETTRQRGRDTLDVVLRPLERRMMYEPGSFVFISVPEFADMKRELHPFSLSSSPLDRDLRVSVRQVGDFTRRLGQLRMGERYPDFWTARLTGAASPTAEGPSAVEVYGPFGGFTLHRFAQVRRIVMVGAGIGITPFLGMLAFERETEDFRRIWLYYVVREAEDAVYEEEIERNCEQSVSYIDYHRWVTRERGRITAKAIAADLHGLQDYAVMLCGQPAFTADLVGQFRAMGVPRERIIFEELQFH